MNPTEIKRVVIAGGGTAGWIAAAALSHQLGRVLDITLIESDEIGTVGVGEASIPPMKNFHKLLTIDEQAFMRATAATFKLGITFDNWGKLNDHYVHAFGRHGTGTMVCDFHHFWLRSVQQGSRAELGEYCLELQAANAGKFATSAQSEINYAYHLDASLYAKFLRKFAEAFGVKRIEGKIKQVKQNAESGFIEGLLLESGQAIEGDLFIDCTGFRGLLIEQTLQTGYEDWSGWLPCDSAFAVQTVSTGPAVPYTQTIAHEAGWRWRIPLQHRVGNGVVYCSRHLSDEEAKNKLLREVAGALITEPRLIKFKAGRRLKGWNKNCIALGLASGFLEPLESTSIHLIMTGIIRLIQLFPFGGVESAMVNEYNNQARAELEKIRDFIILHYHATQREDSEFWRYCKTMEIPESLQHRIQLFRKNAHVYQAGDEIFRVDSWIQVMFGQGYVPEHFHPLARTMADQDMVRFMRGLKTTISQTLATMPAHQDFIDRYCKADIYLRK